MIQSSLNPIASFDEIRPDAADKLLDAWGHYLGPCNRPFGREAYALLTRLGPVAVAVSASTVGKTATGIPRDQCVELARLCRHPDHPWATAACLRLWQDLAAPRWKYWTAHTAVSYCSLREHGPGGGKIYQLAGWKKAATTKGSGAGGSWAKRKGGKKTIWTYPLRAHPCARAEPT